MVDNWVVQVLQGSPYSDSFEEVEPLEFYRSLFSNSRAYMRYGDSMELPVTYSNWAGDESGTWRSEKLFDIPYIVEDRNDAYLPACTHFPKRVKNSDGSYRWVSSNSKETADELCAFVLDIDRCNVIAFENYINTIWPLNGLPRPTVVVASGHGVHLYYILDWPVAMMKRWYKELEHIQRWLGNQFSGENPTFTMVNGIGSDDLVFEDLDARLGAYDGHGLTQPYRVVGSMSKDESDVVSAWRIGETWDIDDLASMAGLTQKFDIDTFDMEESIKTRQYKEAKRRYDERANEPAHPRSKKKGHNPVFYPWFVSKMKERAPWPEYVGGRYNTVLCAVLAARKDNLSPRQKNPITQDQIEADVREAFEIWNRTAKREKLPTISWQEVRKAISAGYHFNGSLVRIRKSWIAKKCKWNIESQQKRNGRSQEEHLKRARNLQRVYVEDGVTSAKQGRPAGSGTKQQLIQDYAAEHPDANHSEIARALGVSRPTVIKWLRILPENPDAS